MVLLRQWHQDEGRISRLRATDQGVLTKLFLHRSQRTMGKGDEKKRGWLDSKALNSQEIGPHLR